MMLHEMINKYLCMDIIYTPIDIDISRLGITIVEGTDVVSKFNPYWDSTYLSDSTVQRNGLDTILDQLPITKIGNIQYKVQQRAVGSHLDVYPAMQFMEDELENIKANEPAGYRILIKGSYDKLEVFDGRDWIAAKMPDIPCCYLINSTAGYHRVKDDPDRTLIYVRAMLDSDRHRALIEKSINKFPEYVIRSAP
jgi:hypothetical protein